MVKKIGLIIFSLIIMFTTQVNPHRLNAIDTPQYKRVINLGQAYSLEENLNDWSLEFDNNVIDDEVSVGEGVYYINSSAGYSLNIVVGEELDLRKYDGINSTTYRIEFYDLTSVDEIILPSDFGIIIDYDLQIENYCLFTKMVDNPIVGPVELYTTCTNILSESNILGNYTALIEGIVTIRDNNYSSNSNYPGIYNITLSLTDIDGNKLTRIIKVIVRDNIAPVIKVIDNNNYLITSYLSNPLSITEIINRLSVTDNYDTNLKGSLIYDATNYLNNKNNVGTYTIDFYVRDAAGNSTSQIINIQIINDLGPIVTAPATIYKSSRIVFNTTDVLNTITLVVDQDGNEIPLHNVSGEIDTRFFKVTFDNFTGNADKQGTYTIKLKSTDVQKRASIYTFTINVYDDIPNIIYYNNTIFTTSDVVLSESDLIKISSKFNLTSYTNSNSIVTFLVNEYALYDHLPGHSYSVKIRFVAPSGHEEYVNLTIKVFDGNAQVIPDKSMAMKILEFIIYWINKLFIHLFMAIIVGFILVKWKKSKNKRNRRR